jgi:hydroxyacylglutathione hydrolase
MLAPGVCWFDDWFALEEIGPGVIAIGEPRFHQINWNYLVSGNRRSLLFDTGPGVRDISRVVRALTPLPVTALASHLHFDHTGNLHRFDRIAMADLPELRECDRDGVFMASDDRYRGFREGMVWTPLKVSRWLPIGSTIDLGGRVLEIVHTPGHSPDSISLFDAEGGLLFAADYVYLGNLYAQIPGADLAAYLDTANRLLPRLGEGTRILGAHGLPDERGEHRAPVLRRGDVADLAAALEGLRTSNERPAAWPVNARMTLLTAEPAFRAWQAV